MEEFISHSKKKLETGHKKVAFSDLEHQQWQIENQSPNEGAYFGRKVVFFDRRAKKLADIIVNLRKKDTITDLDLQTIKLIQKGIHEAHRSRDEEVVKERNFLLKDIFVPNPTTKHRNLQRAFLSPVMSNEKIVQRLEKLLKKNFSSGLKLERVLSSVTKMNIKNREGKAIDECASYFVENPKKFTLEFVEEIIQQRSKIIEDLSDYLDKNKEFFTKEFNKKFSKIVDKYELPISQEKINERTRGLYMRARDPLLSGIEAAGSYVLDSHTITIGVFSKEQSIEKTLDHELIHAISGGVTIKRDTTTFDNNTPEFTLVKHGLGFYRPQAEQSGSKKVLSWMNEGITEKINSEMNPDANHTYENERAIVDCLIHGSGGDISKKDFYEAYFEEYSEEYGTQNSPWRKLVTKFKEAYGPSLIREINDWVKEEGSEAALEKLKLKTGLLQ